MCAAHSQADLPEPLRALQPRPVPKAPGLANPPGIAAALAALAGAAGFFRRFAFTSNNIGIAPPPAPFAKPPGAAAAPSAGTKSVPAFIWACILARALAASSGSTQHAHEAAFGLAWRRGFRVVESY